MIPRIVVRSALLLSFWIAGVAVAGPYSAMYVFGDSLSDNGSDFALSTALHAAIPSFPVVPGAPADFPGRFSNGTVAVENLAARLGLPLTPHYLTPPFLGGLTGGTNYAQGGATTGVENASLPGTLPGGLSTGFKGVTAELHDYVTSGAVADPGALYVVWGGPNDFIHPGATAILPSCVASPSPVVCTGVTNIVNAVATLAAFGANHILVPNLPDLGEVPRTIAGGPAAIASAHAASVAFNAALSLGLASLAAPFPGVIVPFDTFGWLDTVVHHPADFGFVNVNAPCLTGSAADATSTISATCAAVGADRFVFWDDIHPTARAHAILGEAFAAAVVPAPATLALVFVALMMAWSVRRKAWRATIVREPARASRPGRAGRQPSSFIASSA